MITSTERTGTRLATSRIDSRVRRNAGRRSGGSVYGSGRRSNYHNWLRLAIMVLSILGTASLASPVQAASRVRVRVAIERVQALDNLDTESAADFFAFMRINDHETKTATINDQDVIRPDWVFFQSVDLNAEGLNVEFEVWDEDGGLNGPHDHVDVNGYISGGRNLGIGVGFEGDQCGIGGIFSEVRVAVRFSHLLNGGRWADGVCRISGIAQGRDNDRAELQYSIEIAEAPPPERRYLQSWWSPSREDNFTTTDLAWRGAPGSTRAPDYVFVRSEGLVYFPFMGQPAGTIPLYSWYSPTRGDNFLTTDPAWAGKPGDVHPQGYVFVRLEGYVAAARTSSHQRALYSWWSSSREDNFATTHPSWAGNMGDTRWPDYHLYRVEGYLQPFSYRVFLPQVYK